ncbi:unnamed protein product [Ascophyllum nodosum]
MHIYQKYIREGAVLELGSIPAEERARIKNTIEASVADRSAITADMFDVVQRLVFKEMFYNTFQRFVDSPEYARMHEDIKNAYNKVCPDDFLYMERIGEGGFGRVWHVKKKSTGKHYAMKIQLKTALLDTFHDDPTRIDNERRVLSVAHHPFIVDMDYAFQTPTMAIMCLDFVTGGDLQQEAIDASSDGRLGVARVQFYTAEIILALAHLHDLGLMYRDLKPCNVLLNEDGHIKLADMGGVAEFADGTCPTRKKVGMLLYYLLDRQKKLFSGTEIGSLPAKQDESTASVSLSNTRRRRSIMGTQGYMAPEMVILPKQPRAVRMGYSNAVDYWSLDITVFKLLTGSRPFDRRRFQAFQLLESVEWPEYVSTSSRDVICGLLAGRETERLGGTSENVEKLKQHSFFEGIDWLRLSQRHMIPPYLPEVPNPPREDPIYDTFDRLVKEFQAQQESESAVRDTYDWFMAPTDEDQKFFDSWDFVSMHTLKIELGVSCEMDVHDRNF